MRWVLEAAPTAGNGSWEPVGAAVWAMTANGAAYPYPHLSYPTPAARGSAVLLDHRFTWPGSLQMCAGGFEWAAGFVGIAVSGARGNIWAARQIILAGFLLDAVVALVAAVGFHALGDWRNEAQSWLLIWPQSVYLLGVLLVQSRIVLIQWLYILSLWVICIIIVMRVYQNSLADALIACVLPGPANSLTFLNAVIIFFRWRTLRRARRLVEMDQGRYAQAWAAVQQAPGAAAWIDELREVTAGLVERCPRAAVRQTVRLIPRRGRDPGAAAGYGPGFGPDGAVVTGLDQVYVQALCVYPVLKRKVQQWAAAAEGLHQIVRTSSGPADAAAPLVQVRIAGIKSVSRSVEKAVRVYAQVGVRAAPRRPAGAQRQRRGACASRYLLTPEIWLSTRTLLCLSSCSCKWVRVDRKRLGSRRRVAAAHLRAIAAQ